MAVSLADLEAVSNAALRVDSNPLGLVGRLAGLSADEQRAGIPGYAWLGIGAGVGLLGGYFLFQSKILSRILDRG